MPVEFLSVEMTNISLIVNHYISVGAIQFAVTGVPKLHVIGNEVTTNEN